MKRVLRMLAAAGPFVIVLVAGPPAVAQKSGGILRVPWFDSPPSLSLLEESTVAANRPMMGVFNNLVIYKQDVPQNSMKSIVPDLVARWSWKKDACGRPPRGNAERSGRRVGRMWTPAISAHDGLAPIA